MLQTLHEDIALSTCGRTLLNIYRHLQIPT